MTPADTAAADQYNLHIISLSYQSAVALSVVRNGPGVLEAQHQQERQIRVQSIAMHTHTHTHTLTHTHTHTHTLSWTLLQV